MNTPILSDDFIDEALVRFARGTRKDFARYIEDAVAAHYHSTQHLIAKNVLDMNSEELFEEYLGNGTHDKKAITLLRNNTHSAALERYHSISKRYL